MFNNLKRYFPSLQQYETIPVKLNKDFRWFIDEKGQLIGIHQNELDDKSIALLQTFLKPFQPIFPQMTEEEEKWHGWIQNNITPPEFDITYRLVYFQIPHKQMEPQVFKDAINQLFEKDITMLWETENEGVIIETKTIEENISYKEIIDILMSDLYANIHFFVGPYRSSLKEIKNHYQQLLSSARTVFRYSESNVISYVEAIPFLLMDQTEPAFKKEIQKLVLQDFQDDTDFIKMMEVFLSSNLNISVAAKKLYMHRNSLQYRIDKFYEKTGIDVREFHQAITVYLTLLTIKS